VLLAASVSFIASVSYFRLLDNYELTTLDLRFLLRYPKVPVSDKIVIIEIGEDSIAQLGRFPFDRSYHAILVKALTEFGARMVGFDLLFSESSDHDDELKNAIVENGNVYLPFAFDLRNAKKSGIVTADGYLAKCLDTFIPVIKGSGHINIIPDSDGKYRRIPVFVEYAGNTYPYMSYVMGCDYLGKKTRIPLDDRSMMPVNFSGKWGSSFKHYSYVDVLKSYASYITGQKPEIDPSEFKDKICLVGLTAAGTSDIHASPLETLYPGVGMHAELLNSMLNNKFLVRMSRTANLIILIFLCLVIFIVTLSTKPLKGLFALILMIVVFIASSVILFNVYGIWNDIAWPLITAILLYLAITLYKYAGEWKKRILMENELGIAKKIQESFLPKGMPEIEGMDIASVMFTARQVGGDLYDFCRFDNERLGVMIGDVSGKGVPASLFMAMVIGAFRSIAGTGIAPNDLLVQLNSKLLKESSSNLFVTAFYAIFDFKNKTVVYSSGGHLPLLYISANGKVKFLDCEEGMPLGLAEGAYLRNVSDFGPGDVFVFYTDGITEAMNSRAELYGADRLESILAANRNLGAADILKTIEKDARTFEPKAKQHDDITLIVIKIL